MKSDISAGIVLFNPDIDRLCLSLESLSNQVELIVLVDNGSANIEEVEKSLTHFKNTILIKNNRNLGLAYALNQLCRYASDQNSDWILTLDQDTVCPPSMVSELLKYSEDNTGILCPAVDYEGLSIKSKADNKEVTQTYACMTSGSLTNICAWKEVGGFRDELFVDFVDNDFCMKLELHHYKILRVNSCIMHHQLGEAQEKKILGLFRFKASCHSPWRYYYMIRNNLVFIWDYKSYLNVIKEYLKLAYVVCYGIISADDRKKTFSYMIKGYKDARHHKLGQLTDTILTSK